MPINYTNKILIGGRDVAEGNTFNQTNEAGSMGTQGQQGDAVAGDKIDGDVDKSQGKTEIAGDMSGNIENTNIQGGQTINEAVEYVDNLEAEFNKTVAEESGDVAPREIPDKEPVDTVITPFEEFDVESIDAENPDPPQVFSAMRSMAAAPPEASDPEKAEGLFSRFKTMATKAGPKVGKALLAGSIAFAKGTVKQHPMYAGIQAGLESFQE